MNLIKPITNIFEGGINLVDPAQSIPPGELVAAENFEVDLRTYV